MKVRYIAATNRHRSAICDSTAPIIRPDLLSRFPSRIHLKLLCDKKPDAWPFYKKAIRHYSKLLLINRVGTIHRIPDWHWPTLEQAFKMESLPDNFRDLRSFVATVFENRVIYNRPWLPRVECSEIQQAINENRSQHKAMNTVSINKLDSFVEFKIALQSIANSSQPKDVYSATEDEIENLIFIAKRLALDISKWYSQGVI